MTCSMMIVKMTLVLQAKAYPTQWISSPSYVYLIKIKIKNLFTSLEFLWLPVAVTSYPADK